ncbi:WXG100 family type VII secretion target [Kitasatospora sp. NPDC004272]
MSNDEQAWYAEAGTPAEPAHVLHRMVETPVEADRFEVDTAGPESIALDPVQPRERMGGLLQPMQQGVPASEQASPEMLLPRQGLEQASPEMLLPRERVLPAEPLLPRQGLEQPVEPFQQARTDFAAPSAEHPVEPAYAPLQPMQQGVPLSRATPDQAANRTAARNAASGSGSSGGAGSGFRVDPDQYRAAVSPLLAAADQLGNAYRSLSAYLPSLEAQDPWGNDESGKKFAEGEHGYVNISHSTMTLFKSLSGGLKDIADGLKQMADRYQNADDDTVAELGGIDSTAPMPDSPSLPSTPPHLMITPGMTQSGRH